METVQHCSLIHEGSGGACANMNAPTHVGHEQAHWRGMWGMQGMIRPTGEAFHSLVAWSAAPLILFLGRRVDPSFGPHTIVVWVASTSKHEQNVNVKNHLFSRVCEKWSFHEHSGKPENDQKCTLKTCRPERKKVQNQRLRQLSGYFRPPS